jgi:hypothetical protein
MDESLFYECGSAPLVLEYRFFKRRALVMLVSVSDNVSVFLQPSRMCLQNHVAVMGNTPHNVNEVGPERETEVVEPQFAVLLPL